MKSMFTKFHQCSSKTVRLLCVATDGHKDKRTHGQMDRASSIPCSNRQTYMHLRLFICMYILFEICRAFFCLLIHLFACIIGYILGYHHEILFILNVLNSLHFTWFWHGNLQHWHHCPAWWSSDFIAISGPVGAFRSSAFSCDSCLLNMTKMPPVHSKLE